MAQSAPILELDKERILKLLDADGPFCQYFKGFEPRPQQIQMLSDIVEAYNNRSITLIEAGTGTGKSLAYLIPAILWYRKYLERTVISTNTINLQEQLLFKDIPLVTKALKVDCNATLVKGMGNYVCLRKLKESRLELPLMSKQEIGELEKIEAWSESTTDGSRSSLPIVPSAATWEKVGAEYDTCNHKDCPFYKDCFYFKARRAASEAHILIVNHHLLCSDLILRSENPSSPEGGILPPYTRIILDEAHNLEETATDFFSARMNQLGFLHNLSKISSEKLGKPCGKLQILKQQINSCYKKGWPHEIDAIFSKLNTEVAVLRIDLVHAIHKTCEAFKRFSQLLMPGKNGDDLNPNETKLRVLEFHRTHPYWENEIVPASKEFIEKGEKFIQSLDSLAVDLIQIKNSQIQENTKNTLFDIKALSTRLTEDINIIRNFIAPQLPPDKVRWIETQNIKGSSNTCLFDADLDVSKGLANYLFNKFPTTILVSATLTTNHRFDFTRQRLGLSADLIERTEIVECKYDSPFNYPEQALLAVPTDIPSPTHPEFSKAAAEQILLSLQASRGNAFVLFTSYAMLKTCYELILDKMLDLRFNPMKQGDTNRQTLLTKFKQTDRAVLFGTDSFWEGVDVAGEALRCVILVKLPFRVPTEPILQARCEAIAAKGGNPFLEYSLPRAIVKFKQGFGRLIRNKKDHGCIVCLDERLLSKSYGKLFLESLPHCQQVFAPMAEIHEQMKLFYKRSKSRC